MRIFNVFLIIATALLTASCTGISYYSQAVKGHLKLMNARQDVQTLLDSEETDTNLKQRLQLATDIRRFASAELGLPDNDSYKTYVETNKQYVTWNVVAAEEFSVQAKTWCFPVAGCVSYKGYFDQADAQAYAAQLDEQNFETTINGATAYSTLGWFDDPILDIMLRGQDVRIAGLIFHELAHQKLYIKGDSDFNEAFASFVEQEGVRRWLRKIGREKQLSAYADWLQRRTEFSEMLMSARNQLESLYYSDLSDEQKRQAKTGVFSSLRIAYSSFKKRHNGYSGYDRWFAKDLNNARLVAISTYRRWVPAFERIFTGADDDFQIFYREVGELGDMNKTDRQAILAELLTQPD